MVVLFRAMTFYLQILIGLVYLPLVGGAGEIMQRARSHTPRPPA